MMKRAINMEKQAKHYDVVISGAGAVGLICALLLAQKSTLKIAIIDPKPLEAITQSDDTRNIALMQSSLNLLKHLQIFDDFVKVSKPLESLHIVDATNRLLRAPEVIFTAKELGLDCFALNVPIGTILKTLATKLPDIETIDSYWNDKPNEINVINDIVNLSLDSKKVITSNLLIGADGRTSFSREAADIQTTTKKYPQTALGFSFSHTRSLGNVSVEFHRKNGPFTLIPMQDPTDGYQTSIVWSESDETAQHLKQLDSKKLAQKIENITNGILGNVTKISHIGSFPLTNTNCSSYAKNRTILVGEAAHILPPIGAQGMNLGFQDAAAAAELILEAHNLGADIGGEQILETYNKQRKLDINVRGKATDMLNTSLLSNLLPMQFARGMGLFMLQKSTSLRTNIMKKALVPLGHVPKSML
ncbi:MAG: FAD-dependent monooxygenase [Hyphomicrobiales bacterium]